MHTHRQLIERLPLSVLTVMSRQLVGPRTPKRRRAIGGFLWTSIRPKGC